MRADLKTAGQMDGFRVTGELAGLQPLLAQLAHLSQAQRNKILRPALTKGARIVAKAVKERAPVSGQRYVRARWLRKAGAWVEKMISAALKKAVGFVVKTTASGAVIAKIGIRKGFKVKTGVRQRGKHKGEAVYQDPARIAHLVELGHDGPHPAGPHSFMRAGFDAVKEQAAAVIAEEIRQGIAREAGRKAA